MNDLDNDNFRVLKNSRKIAEIEAFYPNTCTPIYRQQERQSYYDPAFPSQPFVAYFGNSNVPVDLVYCLPLLRCLFICRCPIEISKCPPTNTDKL